MRFKKDFRQYLAILLVQIIALFLLDQWMDGLRVQSIGAALGVAAAYVAALILYWWLFLHFFSWLPVWIFPLISFALADVIFLLLEQVVPGILTVDLKTAVLTSILLTTVNAILGGFLSLDVDARFDEYIARKLVAKRSKPERTQEPGFLFLEIDGLGQEIFERALSEGRMPTLKRWAEAGTHRILPWETDFTSQTGAIQSGILLGNNENIPAYRWWDRKRGRTIRVGNFGDAAEIEANLSNGSGLLSRGGASRGNLFSGDADECLFTLSAIDNRKRDAGPMLYLYLINPFTMTRLLTRYVLRVLLEWLQALWQKIRRDKFIVSARGPRYAFLRAAIDPLLQDITTFTVISDLLRGLPAIYTVYPAYDDLAHFAGMNSPEAMQSLEEIDRYFARLENVLKITPRPYYPVVLSDHGQSTGPTFQAAYGETLEQLVQKSLGDSPRVIAPAGSNDAWDKINTFLNDSLSTEMRSTRVLRTMLQSKMQNGLVAIGPPQDEKETQPTPNGDADHRLMVLVSGCAGLIYFTDSRERASYEEIQSRYPDLLLNLISHPGIGFVLVRSAHDGDLVLGKLGIYFLDQDFFEGENPLSQYSKNAPQLLRRESSFSNCPDILVNTNLDPASGELPGFENQVSHHGGLGGPQNRPFIFHPAFLPLDGKPLVGAVEVNRLFTQWKAFAQNRPGHSEKAPDR